MATSEPTKYDASSTLVNKSYVDNGKRTKFIMSIQTPTDVPVGTIWYQLPPSTYTMSQIDALDYTFNDVDAIGITWGDADKGGW